MSYKQQAEFSFAYWPFSVKLLWAPIGALQQSQKAASHFAAFDRWPNFCSWQPLCRLFWTEEDLVGSSPVSHWCHHVCSISQGDFALSMFFLGPHFPPSRWMTTLGSSLMWQPWQPCSSSSTSWQQPKILLLTDGLSQCSRFIISTVVFRGKYWQFGTYVQC